MTRQQRIVLIVLGIVIGVALIMLAMEVGKPAGSGGQGGPGVGVKVEVKPVVVAVVEVEAEWAAVVVVAKGTKRSEEWVPVWFEVPKALEGMEFSKPRPYQGALTFKVVKAGVVTLAVPLEKWGDADHSGGPWRKEVLVREKLPELGWKEEGPINGGEYLLLTRECEAGETFTMRTRKYSGPVLFRPR